MQLSTIYQFPWTNLKKTSLLFYKVMTYIRGSNVAGAPAVHKALCCRPCAHNHGRATGRHNPLPPKYDSEKIEATRANRNKE